MSLRYNLCSAWFLDIRISTCFSHAFRNCIADFTSICVVPVLVVVKVYSQFSYIIMIQMSHYKHKWTNTIEYMWVSQINTIQVLLLHPPYGYCSSLNLIVVLTILPEDVHFWFSFESFWLGKCYQDTFYFSLSYFHWKLSHYMIWLLHLIRLLQ